MGDRCGIRLLGRSASESGRFCQGSAATQAATAASVTPLIAPRGVLRPLSLLLLLTADSYGQHHHAQAEELHDQCKVYDGISVLREFDDCKHSSSHDHKSDQEGE